MSSKPQPVRFPPAMFRFLTELRENNNRDWFGANRDRYESDVRDPLQAFIVAFAGPLHKISPQFVADPKRSMFRIYRDTRFSKDKTPYKTHAAARFRHVEAGGEVHTPGFYLHLGPDEVFCGAGIWRPAPATANAIRHAISDDPTRWKRVARGARFRKLLALGGESLKRPPRGFDREHPLLEDLMRKDFICSRSFERRQATSAEFPKEVAQTFRAAAPLIQFLCDAVGLKF